MTSEATPGEPIAEPKSELSPTDKLHHNVALAIARQVEHEIRQALNAVMGTEDWKFEDLTPRCARLDLDGVESFIFDNVVLVKFGPPDVERTTEGGKPYLRVVREIERCWQELEEVAADDDPGQSAQSAGETLH